MENDYIGINEFFKDYAEDKDIARCFLNFNKETNKENFKILFIEKDKGLNKAAIFLLPDYTLNFSRNYSKDELNFLKSFIKKNENEIYYKLDIGINKYREQFKAWYNY